MGEITMNPSGLNKEDIDYERKKVRALIINDNNEIILTKYAGIYMLPGGKVEQNENSFSGLFRELYEELGIEIDILNMQPIVTVNNFVKDYPVRNTNWIVNSLTKTDYCLIKYNGDIKTNDKFLTDSEKKGNFSAKWISLYQLKDLLDENNDSIIFQTFKKELILLIKYYIENIELFEGMFQYMNNEMRNPDFLSEILHEKNSMLENIEFQKDHPLIDLHTHTNYSDGEFDEKEVIKGAIANGVGTMSITDHDTINAYKNEMSLPEGFQLITGMEITAKDKERMHILGYDFDINNECLNKKLNSLNDININAMLSLIEQIKKDYGIRFSLEQIKSLINSKGAIGRPDIAKLCIENGYAQTFQEAFDRYLTNAYRKIGDYRKGISYEECLDLIINSGGIPVIAHPKSLKRSDNELLTLLSNMKSCGLMGIEAFHPSHTYEEQMKFLIIANKLDLLISGGSDYHGPNIKPERELGMNSIKELSLLKHIKSRH